MRLLTRISDIEKREAAQSALLEGESSDMVKMKYLSREQPAGSLEILQKEKLRLEKSIKNMEARIEEINKRIDEYTSPSEGSASENNKEDAGPEEQSNDPAILSFPGKEAQ